VVEAGALATAWTPPPGPVWRGAHPRAPDQSRPPWTGKAVATGSAWSVLRSSLWIV